MNDEEMLTRGLRSLAAEMESVEAPEAMEAKVLEAFRAQRKVVPHKVIPMPRRHSNARYWLVAVAAMLLIAITVVVFRWNTGTVETPRQAKQQATPQDKPKLDEQQPSSPQQFVAGADDETTNPLPQRRKPRRVHAASRSDVAQVANHVNEIATDFIPIGYLSAANLQDGGQIVRVQLPRAALVNFGLPVNMDRYNEKVKADVLLGVDGRAHAIRFVQ
jgi:hypothetical protein